MKVHNANYLNQQNFKAIKLNADEIKTANAIIKEISGKKAAVTQRQDGTLFNIFYKHIQQEAELKSKKYYFYDEIISELSLFYSEIIKKIKDNGGGLKKIVDSLNEYKPSIKARKPEYLHCSLDERIGSDDGKKSTYADFVTENDLFVPESAEVNEQKKQLLNSLISSASVTPLVKSRMEKLISGTNAKNIADKEKVSLSTVCLSRKKACLLIQKAKGIIPKEVCEKAKRIKEELGLSISEDIITNLLIKHPTMIYLNTNLLKNRFDAALSLFKCDKKVLEDDFVNFFSILGDKTETLKRNIENISKEFNLTEEQVIKLGLKCFYFFTTTTERLKSNLQKTASATDIPYSDVLAFAIKNPTLFFYSPDGMKKRKNLRLYYNKLTNNKNSDFSICSIYLTNYSQWYRVILSYILMGEKILRDEKAGTEKLINYIKSLNKNAIYNYNIPQGESASGLINYAKQLSKELLGKNVFRFNTVSDFEPQKQQLAEKLDLSTEQISAIAEQYPLILYLPVQTIDTSLQNFANAFNTTKKTAFNAALTDFDIFVYPTDVMTKKILDAAQKLGGTEKELTDKLIENPKFYKSKLDVLCKKKSLKEYYCKLTHSKYKNKSVFLMLRQPDRYMYNGILTYIITHKKSMIADENFSRGNEMSLAEVIKGMKAPVYEYAIPESTATDGLIDYAEKLSMKILGKNIFKFNVIKEDN